MNKVITDLTLEANESLSPAHALLKLRAPQALPPISAGQFVEVRVDGCASTFLRRPISVNYAEPERGLIWLLVHAVGKGTETLCQLKQGARVNCVLPLGQGFTMAGSGSSCLLVGGGVGTAPLLYLGHKLVEAGCSPTFLLGGKTESDILQAELFARLGRVFTTTEDGSGGERGFVTQHSLLSLERFDQIYTCGPKLMMVAVARYARQAGTPCEASLENLMACGLGACLCCVEKTREGNLCVCKEGPVFSTERLLWT